MPIFPFQSPRPPVVIIFLLHISCTVAIKSAQKRSISCSEFSAVGDAPELWMCSSLKSCDYDSGIGLYSVTMPALHFCWEEILLLLHVSFHFRTMLPSHISISISPDFVNLISAIPKILHPPISLYLYFQKL